jgi:hypothetical protein
VRVRGQIPGPSGACTIGSRRALTRIPRTESGRHARLRCGRRTVPAAS